jgi:flagellin-specific chaperone FliS
MPQITPDDADIGERALADKEIDQELTNLTQKDNIRSQLERDTNLNNLDSLYAHLNKAIVSLPIETQKDILETVASIVELEIELESYNNA